MRAILTLALALGAVGCRTRPFDERLSDDGSFASSDLAAPDLAQPIVDLSPPPDLARTGCQALAQCAAQCLLSDHVCQSVCGQSTSDRGRMLFDLAIACGDRWCTDGDPASGAPQRCAKDPNGGTHLVDADGRPPGDCNLCLQNVFTPLFGFMCPPPADPACVTTACQTPFELCNHN